MTGTFRTRSEEETAGLGRDLAARLTAGSILLVSGDLGAGKTAFVRGVAEGLGIDPREVTSPTFTLIQEYRGGRLPLIHVDLYRLTPREADELGLDEISSGDGITAIEWPDRLPRPFEDAVQIRMADEDGSTRTIEITGSRASSR